MKEREGFDRRRLLRVMGIAAAAPVAMPAAEGLAALGFHPLVPRPQRGQWVPLALSSDELALVADLAETIIPETDTPGARAAHVEQYIDWQLSDAQAPRLSRFRAGLEEFDRDCRERSGSGFSELEPEARSELLAELWRAGGADGGRGFLAAFKTLTIDGYYTSEQGMRDELDYLGNGFVGVFRGCEHPEHLDWEPGE